jgi:hypothetical protein
MTFDVLKTEHGGTSYMSAKVDNTYRQQIDDKTSPLARTQQSED